MAKGYLVYSGSVFSFKLNLYFSCDQVACLSEEQLLDSQNIVCCIICDVLIHKWFIVVQDRICTVYYPIFNLSTWFIYVYELKALLT